MSANNITLDAFIAACTAYRDHRRQLASMLADLLVSTSLATFADKEWSEGLVSGLKNAKVSTSWIATMRTAAKHNALTMPQIARVAYGAVADEHVPAHVGETTDKPTDKPVSSAVKPATRAATVTA